MDTHTHLRLLLPQHRRSRHPCRLCRGVAIGGCVLLAPLQRRLETSGASLKRLFVRQRLFQLRLGLYGTVRLTKVRLSYA